ncbi:MAG: serine/threonine protein kinase [Candidatus Melainabacteria bacterium]|nr:serine/threonine protein kinase [Candidatus Melainabacteria bacterium]
MDQADASKNDSAFGTAQPGVASASVDKSVLPESIQARVLAATQVCLDKGGIRSARLAAAALVIAAILIHGSVAIGNVFNIEWLKSFVYGQKIGFSACFWFVLCGLGCLPVVLHTTNRKLLFAARFLISLTFFFTALLWIEHLFGLDFNTTNIICELPNGGGHLKLPGPVSVDVSFCLALLSLVALLLSFSDKRSKSPFQAVSGLLAIPCLVIVTSAAFGQEGFADRLCTMAGCVQFKLLNFLSLLCLSISLLLSRPEEGFVRLIYSDNIAARLLRGAAAAFPISLIYGMLIVWLSSERLLPDGTRFRLISSEFVLPMSMAGSLAIFVIFLIISARKLEKIATEKEATEQVLMALSKEVDAIQAYKMVCLTCGKEFPDGWVACPYDTAELQRVADRFHPGAVFAEKYEVIEALGSGGMSTVYKAKHKFLEKPVAIKLLNAHLASDGKAVQRFQLEAKAAYDLKHPNLISIYDFGISPDGQAYIVMDYLEGESLSDRIERHGKLPLMEALPIFADIASGLAYAHEHNVLHRDIKPSNVMLTSSESGATKALIVDFGLAKNYEDDSLKLTQTGEIFGSPLYMSPEQCRGSVLDRRSDIYSFGCLMYETLTGYVPIRGTNALETFRLKCTEVPPPFPSTLEIPGWLANLIMSTLRIEVEQRPLSCSHIYEAISVYVRR